MGEKYVKGKRKDILVVDGLKKYYGEIKAVDGISFHVKSGEIYGLLGPNGAGKTTTLKSILGLFPIQGGSIKVLGIDPMIDDLGVKKVIGYVSEEPLLYKSMTPREMLDFIASIRQLEPETATRRARQLLESFDAVQYYESPIITLSKGNQQKVQLIAAFLHDPPLLIMDEPLAGLDARTARVVKDLLRIHVDNGGAVLLSTHIMEQAAELCTRIGIINKGILVAEGTLEELRSLANSTGASLEEIFLKLTEQDQDIKDVVQRLRNAYQESRR